MMMNRRNPIQAIGHTLFLMILFISTSVRAEGELSGHRDFFRQHCEACHFGPKPKGDLDLETLAGNFTDKKVRGHWLTVLDQLQSGEMPPKDKPRSPSDQVKSVIDWISQSVSKAEAEQRATQGRV